MYFKNKVIVITGAGTGIGRGLAVSLSKMGASVVLADINRENLFNVQNEISAFGGNSETFLVDVSSRSSMAVFASDVLEKMKKVDVLINNAGVGLGGIIQDIELDDWEWIIRINLLGVVHGIKFFLPSMIDQKSGHIVNISSSSGLFPIPFTAPYTATKFAVRGLSEVLYAEMKQYGIGVTTVCPGLITTTGFDDASRGAGNIDAKRELKNMRERIGYHKSDLVEDIIQAIENNKAVIKVPFRSSTLLYWLYFLFPKMFSNLMLRASKRLV